LILKVDLDRHESTLSSRESDRAGSGSPRITVLDFPLPQIASGDLDTTVIGQLPPPKFSLGNEFEPGLMKMIRFEAPFWCWRLG
jgi:hypothetical protein